MSLGVIVVMCAILAFLYFVMPFTPVGKPITIDQVVLPDGTELILSQVFTGTLEPYKVSLYCRPRGGPWLWYYVDHQALYWRGRIEINETTNTATVYHGVEPIILFDIANESVYWLESPNHAVQGRPRDPYVVKLPS
jgi:hypothetical protein